MLSKKKSGRIIRACAARVDLLESRQLLSAVLGMDGTLTVTGTSGNDVIELNFNTDIEFRSTTGSFTVDVNGITNTFDAASVHNVVVNGLAGNDQVNVAGTETSFSTVYEQPVNVVMSDGDGSDQITSDVGVTGFDGPGNAVLPTTSITAGDGNDIITESGDTQATLTAGNGNDQFTVSQSDSLSTVVSISAGNGTDQIYGQGSSAFDLTVNATVGTGQDSFSNENDANVFVNATTTDGQTLGGYVGQGFISGRVMSGSSATAKPVAGALVFLDGDNNGLVDGSEAISTTNAQGVYQLVMDSDPTGSVEEFNGYLRVMDAGYSAAPQQSEASTGLGLSGRDFVVVPVATAGQPLVVGTAGSYQNDGNTIANAVDGNVNTYFDAPSGSGGYVGLDYGSPQVISSISYAPRAGWASRMVGGVFQGSNSASFSNAVTLYKVTSAPATGSLTTVPVTAAGAFEFVRYLGPTGGFCNIAEFDPTLVPQAGSVVVQKNGAMVITGTPKADSISVKFTLEFYQGVDTGVYTVVVNNTTTDVNSGSVSEIVINGGDGNDSINVTGGENFDDFPIIKSDKAVSAVVTEGGGNNNIYVSIDSDQSAENLTDGTAPGATVSAGDGNNQIFVGDIIYATVNVGNGNDTVQGSAGYDAESVTVNAGNGDDEIDGLSAGDSDLTMVAHLGTGHDILTDGNDPDISVAGTTSDGQTSDAFWQQDMIAGRATVAGTDVPLANAVVFVDANNNGVLDAGEQSTTTSANGDYNFTITGNTGDNGTIDYPVRLSAAGFGVAPAVINEGFGNSGIAVVNDNFVLTPTTATPTVFGTGGSYQNDGNTIAKAVDGNLNTYFDAPTSSGAFVALDYGSAQSFSQVSFAPRSGWASRMVGGLFQGSNSANFANAVTLYKVTTAPAVGVLTTVNLSAAGTYRYVRYIGPSGGFCNIAEMKFTVEDSAVLGTDGTLTVTGSAKGDAISVDFNVDDSVTDGRVYGTYTVTINGTTSTFDAAGVQKVVINGGDGNDTISVSGYEQTNYVTPAVNVVVTDGNGNDSINVQLAEDGFADEENGVPPSSSVTAGDGDDNVFVGGSTTATVRVGNGNDTLGASAGSDPLTATFYAGNGNDVIAGDSAGDGGLYVNAYVGTGQDTFNNGNDVDIEVSGETSDGQYAAAAANKVIFSGRAYTGTASAPKPVSAATVFIDSNGNGVLDAGEQSTTTDANGDYYLIIPVADNDAPITYNLTLLATGFIATPTVHQEVSSAGFGLTSQNFVLTPTVMTIHPTLFGTSGSYQNDGNTIANVVDGNLNTYFDAPTSSGGYVALDYGSPQVFAQIQYAPRAGWASRMVGGIFQGSNSANFSGAVNLYTITTAPAVGVLTLANVTGAGAFRYVRYVGPTGSFCNIAEMDFILAGKLKGTLIGTAGSYHNQGNTIANAFDGNANTFFDGPDASGDWVGLDVGTATLKAVEFEARAGFESRMVGGEIQASNTADFSSGVVTLATITSKPQAGVMTTLGVSNIYSYRYYRYIGPANGYCDIAELAFIG